MDTPFPYYSVFALTAGVLCVAQGVFIGLKNRHSPANQIYFLFCLATFVWLFSASLMATRWVPMVDCLVLARYLYTAVVFMPTLLVHFAVVMLKNNTPRNTRIHLSVAYCFTFLFLILVWTSSQFITGIHDWPWGYFPVGGVLHKIHTLFVLVTAGYGLFLLRFGVTHELKLRGKTQTYHENKYLFWAFLFLTLASWDFLPNMEIDVYPIGFVFVTLFTSSTTWALFRHNLLGVSVVVKKSLVYSILASVIAVLYFAGIYLVGVFVGDRAQIRSLPVMLALLTTITLLSRPIERKITRAVERLFFKKPIDVMEKENKRLLGEMENQDRLKAVATFAAGMAHEIKNPLTVLKTYTEYLPKKMSEEGFLQEYQKTMAREIGRIEEIVKKLLDFSRPANPRPEPVCATALIRETLRFMEGDFVKNHIHVETHLSEKDSKIIADRKQFQQVLLNLCLNAVEAMPRGGTLTLTAVPDHATNRLIFEIKDTGEGIPEDQLKHVFEPFFTTKPSGTGLGLSIVHNIVVEHRGTIEVGNRESGGAIFTIRWPQG